IPVFYIPQPSSKTDEIASLGSTLVMQLIDASILLMRLAGVKQKVDVPSVSGERMNCEFGFQRPRLFSLHVAETRTALEAFSHGLTPPDMLELALQGALHFFYPADDVPRNKALAYYRQREWRIGGNF